MSVDHYILKRATDAGFTTGVVNTNVGNVTSYHDTTISAGIPYFYKVEAVDNDGEHSGFSDVISIATPVDLVPEDLVSMTESPTGTWVATGVGGPGNVWTYHASCQQKLPAGVNGYVEVEPTVGTTAFGLMNADTVGNYSTIDYGAFNFSGTFYLPTVVDSGVGYSAGDLIRVKRVSGTVSVVRVRSGVETIINTYGGTHNGDLFIGFVLEDVPHTFTNPSGSGVIDK
jgi:hypothetical protein